MSSADDVHKQDGDPTGAVGFTVQPDVEALYHRHREAMFASARKVLGPNFMVSDAGDAVSIVMKNLQQAHSRGQLTNKDDWESYLRWSVRNAALAIVEARTGTDSLDAILETTDGSDTIHDRTEGLDPVAELVIERAEQRDVRAAIAQAGFTDRQLYALHAYFAKQMTDEQIGDWLGITGQAVGKMRRRSQSKLKDLMEGGEST